MCVCVCVCVKSIVISTHSFLHVLNGIVNVGIITLEGVVQTIIDNSVLHVVPYLISLLYQTHTHTETKTQ